MELDKICKLLQNSSIKIEKAYINDIVKITNTIFEEYDITYKNTEIAVEKDIFVNKFKTLFKKDDVLICKGISKNGNKCSRKVNENSKYCKTHNYLSYREIINDNNNDNDTCDTIFVVESNKEDKNILEIENMELKLINDSFYYTDNNYIYEKDTLHKAGYVYNNEFILTDDPFILSNLN
jgi:hypothetical protein